MNRIMIVDDDVRLLDTMRRMLQATGLYEVMTEDSGQRALAAAATFKPDLIILDMNMPGMGGLEFIKGIATPEGPLTYPVLVMTSRANMARFFDDVPVDGFMPKPCEPDRLCAEVARIIALRRASEPDPLPARATDVAQKRVLVGEDDPEVGERLTDIFTRAGYAVHCVPHGPGILGEAIVQRPAVILVKLILTSLNGDAVARMLKEMPNTKDIPVVLYNQGPSRVDAARFAAPQSGIRKYIETDNAQVLLAAVSGILDA